MLLLLYAVPLLLFRRVVCLCGRGWLHARRVQPRPQNSRFLTPLRAHPV